MISLNTNKDEYSWEIHHEITLRSDKKSTVGRSIIKLYYTMIIYKIIWRGEQENKTLLKFNFYSQISLKLSFAIPYARKSVKNTENCKQVIE